MTSDAAGFDGFFDAEYRPLRRLAYLLTGNWDHAEDLVQETMVRTYRAWDRIRRQERPAAYARAVMINRHNSMLRRAMVELKHVTTSRQPDVQQAETTEDAVLLWAAIKQLPARQKAALVLRYYEDLPEAEVAVILDVPVGTVKSLVHRGAAKVRKSLGAEFAGVATGSET